MKKQRHLHAATLHYVFLRAFAYHRIAPLLPVVINTQTKAIPRGTCSGRAANHVIINLSFLDGLLLTSGYLAVYER